MRNLILISLFIFNTTMAFSATKNDHHLQIDHCYHWLNEKDHKYLTHKYNHAKDNDNELTFFTTPGSSNGAVAGAGLYCAKSPSGSYGYGDRLIKIKLVEDVVLYDATTYTKHCGLNGKTNINDNECRNKPWDIKFYSGGGRGQRAWYVIQNPLAIESWSSNSLELENDLRNSIILNDESFRNHALNTISYMEMERKSLGVKDFYNPKSRFSLADIIINRPDELNSMPPLNILSRLKSIRHKDISKELITEIILRNSEKALKSNKINSDELIQIAKQNEAIKITIESLLKKNITLYKKENEFNILNIINNLNININKRNARALLVKILENDKTRALLLASSIDINQYNIDIKSLINPKSLTKDKDKTLIKLTIKYLNDHEKEEFIREIFKFNKQSNNIIATYHGIEIQAPIKKDECLDIAETFKTSSDIKLKIGKHEITYKTNNDSNSDCEQMEFMLKSAFKNEKKHLKNDNQFTYIHGNVESNNFGFIASSLESYNNECYEEYNNNYFGTGSQSIDQINSAKNGESLEHKYNSGSYWKTKEQVCNIILAGAKTTLTTEYALEQKRKAKKHQEMLSHSGLIDKVYIIEGSIQNKDFLFFGEYQEMLQKQCFDLWEVNNNTSIDLIHVYDDDNKYKRHYNSKSYWKTKEQVCGQILNNLTHSIPSKFYYDNMNIFNKLKDSYRYKKVYGKIQNNSFFFYGRYYDEIYKQCSNFTKSLLAQIKRVDSIYYGENERRLKHEYNSSSYWRDVNIICDFITEDYLSLGFEIDKELEDEAGGLQNLYFVQNKKYHKIELKIGERAFKLIGLERDEIINRCNETIKRAYTETNQSTLYKRVSVIYNYENINPFNTVTSHPGEICKKVESKLKRHILSKQEKIQFAADKKSLNSLVEKTNSKLTKKKDYQIIINHMNEILELEANFIDDLNPICENFIKLAAKQALYNRDTSKAKVNINDKEILLDLTSNIDAYKRCQKIFQELKKVSGIKTIQEHNDHLKFIANRKDYLQAHKLRNIQKDSKELILVVEFTNGENISFTGNTQNDFLIQISKAMKYTPNEFYQNEYARIYLVPEENSRITHIKLNTYKLWNVVRDYIKVNIYNEEEYQNILLERELAQEYQDTRKEFKLEINADDKTLYLHGDNNEEVKMNCDQYARIYNLYYYRVQKTQVKMNDKITNLTQDLSGLQGTFCENISIVLVKAIPPEAKTREFKDFTLSQDRIKVIGMYDNLPFYINGETPKDIRQDCRDKYKEMKDLNNDERAQKVSWQIQGFEKSYYTSNRSTIRNSRKFCNLLEKNIKKQIKDE